MLNSTSPFQIHVDHRFQKSHRSERTHCLIALHVCVTGLRLTLHPTQALGRLVPAAARLRSAPTLATRPNTALSLAVALGINSPSASVSLFVWTAFTLIV